jgi:hypothetical protein
MVLAICGRTICCTKMCKNYANNSAQCSNSVLKFSAQIQCSNFVFLFEKIEYGFEYTFALLVLSLPKERDFRLIFWVNR